MLRVSLLAGPTVQHFRSMSSQHQPARMTAAPPHEHTQTTWRGPILQARRYPLRGYGYTVAFSALEHLKFRENRLGQQVVVRSHQTTSFHRTSYTCTGSLLPLTWVPPKARVGSLSPIASNVLSPIRICWPCASFSNRAERLTASPIAV